MMLQASFGEVNIALDAAQDFVLADVLGALRAYVGVDSVLPLA